MGGPSSHVSETLDLPPFRVLMEENGGGPGLQPLGLPATLEPISRPSSTSSQLSLPHLPGISSLASGTPVSGSPQLRSVLQESTPVIQVWLAGLDQRRPAVGRYIEGNRGREPVLST